MPASYCATSCSGVREQSTLIRYGLTDFHVAVVVGVALQHEIHDAGGGEGLRTLGRTVNQLAGLVGILLAPVHVLVEVLLADGKVDTSQTEGTAAHHRAGLLCPVIALGGDITAQRRERDAGQVQEELIVVDGLLEPNLHKRGFRSRDTDVINRAVALLGGAGVLDVEQQRGGGVGGIHLQEALPRVHHVVGGDGGAVRPARLAVQAQVHDVLLAVVILGRPVAGHEGFLYLFIGIQLEERVKQKPHHIGQRLVGVRFGGIQVVDVVGQVRRDVLTLISVVRFAATDKAGSQHDGAKQQSQNTFCHNINIPPRKRGAPARSGRRSVQFSHTIITYNRF